MIEKLLIRIGLWVRVRVQPCAASTHNVQPCAASSRNVQPFAASTHNVQPCAASTQNSVCCRHIIFVIAAPIIALETTMNDLYESCCGISLFMRIISYPPNFSKMAASTIDPATGASTLFFCSHISVSYTHLTLPTKRIV